MNIAQIEGIGPVYAGLLAKSGIVTTHGLLKRAANPKGRQELAEATGISEKLILEWVNHADLMRIRGVGSEFSDLLEAAGVDTIKELRHRNPENLYEAMLKLNAEKKIVRRAPSQNAVRSWIAQAQTLDALLTY